MTSIGMAPHCPNALSWWNVAASPCEVTCSKGNVPDHEEGTGAERVDQALDSRLQVLDDVAQVMNRAVEGMIGKGRNHFSPDCRGFVS
jgi:hypothetical protein